MFADSIAMTGIYPVPTTRTSDLLGQSRLVSQLQSDQLDIVRLQSQISTGRRLAAPSDDAPAAQRALSLQRLLELKAQAKANLDSTNSYLAASDSALASVSQLITQARATALGAATTTSTDTQRATAAEEVQRSIDQLVAIGNQSFQGRYLFAGSRATIAPFSQSGANVVYNGNEGQLASYADIDQLVASNVTGSEVFGAYSPAIAGKVDLNPVVTAETRLADLRGGRGIRPGSIAISDGNQSSVIDISSAKTVGDVASLIARNAPPGRTLTVQVTPTGLAVDLDDAGGGNLTIDEVGGGTTAGELGLRNIAGTGTAPLIGTDLDPILRGTTPLTDILGGAALDPAGLQIENGGQTFTVSFAGAKTVEDLLNALNGSPAQVLAEIDPSQTGIRLRSRLSGSDFSVGENGGTTATQLGLRSLTSDTRLADLNFGRGVATATEAGNGVDFTIQRRDGVQLAVDISSAQTVGDVLERINNDPANLNPATRVVARLAAFGNGIELVDNNPAAGTLKVIKGFGSEAARDLGLVPAGATESLPASGAVPAGATIPPGNPPPPNVALKLAANQPGIALNGVQIVVQSTLSGNVAAASFNAVTKTLTIKLDAAATTADTVRAAINAQGTFHATLDPSVDVSNNGTGVFGSTGTIATTAGGTVDILTGRDPGPLEVNGLFNSLVRLKTALLTNDLSGIQRTTGMLDEDLNRVNLARGEVGAREQSLDLLKSRLDDEDVQLRSTLSSQIDTDFAEAVSNLAGRQAALQASLQLSAQALRLTLLDYL